MLLYVLNAFLPAFHVQIMFSKKSTKSNSLFVVMISHRNLGSEHNFKDVFALTVIFQVIVIIHSKYYSPDKERFVTLPTMPGLPVHSTAVG